MLSVEHAPGFYRSPNSGLMPSDPTTFGSVMQAMASSYAGKVKAYELWNEENLARETGAGNVDPSTYLPLLKAGLRRRPRPAIPTRGPAGRLEPDRRQHARAVHGRPGVPEALYALNGGEAKNYFDVLGAHPSGFSNPPDCTPATPQCSLSGGWNNDRASSRSIALSQYHDVMVADGDDAKKIWFTEFGY